MASKIQSDPIISILTLKGGLNNTDPAPNIANDQVVEAMNVEWFSSPLGERRLGCESVDIFGSSLDAKSAVVFLGTHQPLDTEFPNSELWAIAATYGTSVVVARRSGAVWSQVSVVDTIDPSATTVGRIHTQSIHGKNFIVAKNSVDRIHVWDGSTFRRGGLAAPILAPTASDTASVGTFADDRIYRVRFTTQNADGDTTLRSEPSPELSFTPAGTKTGVTVTRPAVEDGNETHWELEASSGDGNFYVIATTPIATTTYTDTNTPATSYSSFELSETIGNYSLIPSVKFVVADQDRLIFGSSWEDSNLGSRVMWTPVSNATGSGNDERIPVATNNYLDLDWMTGGNLTGISDPVNGSFYAFKLARTYKLQRSGDVSDAYTSYLLSTSRGAIEGSIVNGIDEYGGPCVYFLDPSIGPCRIGSSGIQEIKGVRETWRTVNINNTTVISHGIYYPDKQQVIWWVATSGSSTPNLCLKLQVSELRSSDAGSAERGWSLADGDIATALCSTVFPEEVSLSGITRLSFRPYIGKLNPDGLCRCDVGDTDNGTAYTSTIVTKPFIVVGLTGRWGVMDGSLLGKAIDDDTRVLNVTLIRDFGKEELSRSVDFVPESSETIVNNKLDDLSLSQSYAIQVKFTDAS